MYNCTSNSHSICFFPAHLWHAWLDEYFMMALVKSFASRNKKVERLKRNYTINLVICILCWVFSSESYSFEILQHNKVKVKVQ